MLRQLALPHIVFSFAKCFNCTLAIFEALLGVRTGIEEPFPPAWVAAMPPTQRISLDAWAALERTHEVQRAYWTL